MRTLFVIGVGVVLLGSASAATAGEKSPQSITFAALPDRTVGDEPFAVSASASSGLPVSFTTSTPAVCGSGGDRGATITVVGDGTCTVVAEQSGNREFRAAPDVTRSFRVRPEVEIGTPLMVEREQPDDEVDVAGRRVRAPADEGSDWWWWMLLLIPIAVGAGIGRIAASRMRST